MATNKNAKKAPKKEEVKITPEVVEEAPEVIEEEPVKSDVIWKIKGGKAVHQKGFLRMKAVRWPIDKKKLPEDIQKWLTNKGYGTNIYLRSKEELEKRNVDLKMVQKLKDFISKNFL